MSETELLGAGKYLADKRYGVLAYTKVQLSPDGKTQTLQKTTWSGTTTTTTKPPPSLEERGKVQLAGSSYVYNGLYISLIVARDFDITSEYRYDIVAFFDWQGSTAPYDGVSGVDGVAVYWANNLALRWDTFWGKYRDNTNLQNISRNDPPPNSGVAWSFWEAKNNNLFGSIANYGYLNASVGRTNYTNTLTNFTFKYIHTWQNNNFNFSWGSGPSVSFSPSAGTHSIVTPVALRT